MYPIVTIDPHNHEDGTDIRRVHGPGEDVHTELKQLDLQADLT